MTDTAPQTVAGLTWEPWPTLAIPSEPQLAQLAAAQGIDAVLQFHRAYHDCIAREQHDPLIEGWDSPPTRTLRA